MELFYAAARLLHGEVGFPSLRETCWAKVLYQTLSPSDSANPLGQLYSLSVIKFQSFIACDKIEARGWIHNDHFREPYLCDSLLCGGLNSDQNECLNQSTNFSGLRVRKAF